MNTLPSTRSPMARFPAMARWSPLLVVVALLAACGGDPPVPCPGQSIPQVTVHVRETKLLQACFDDPENEELKISARSSNDEVVTELVLDPAVRVKGISPGDAVVTITAEDPGGQTASIDVDVHVPNRAPIAKGELADVRMLVDGSRRYEVDLYFFDPDEQPLSFSVRETNPTAVGVTMDSIKMDVKGLAEGVSVITVVATDPGGLTATREFEVAVFEPVTVWRADFDDFDRGGFNPYWTTVMRIEDSKAVAASRYSGYWGWAPKLGFSAEEWELTSSLGKAATENNNRTAPGLLTYYGGSNPIYVGTMFGYEDVSSEYFGADDDRNFTMVYFNYSDWWTTDDDLWGYSDACEHDRGELFDVAFANRNGDMTVTCGTTLVLRVNREEKGWPHIYEMENTYLAILGLSAYQYVEFDWVELTALPPEEEQDARVAWDEGPPEVPHDVFTFERGIDVPR